MERIDNHIKIGTLNLCLGLKYKKDLISELLKEFNIDVLSMQEIELEHDFECDLLSIPGYKLETEVNKTKKRVGFYKKNHIKYERKINLEGNDSHLIIIDCENGLKNKKRIINIYRSFNPANETAKDLFERQLRLIKNAFNDDCIIMGDLNLDYKKT